MVANQQAAASQKSRPEQQTENETNCHREQVDSPLSSVNSRFTRWIEPYSGADRIEHAARYVPED
jgi:hypothetical protein